jgi:PAS domain S-box-containing protein
MTKASFPRAIDELGPGDHLCCIYETEEEHRAVLTPFLRRGLERGERVLYIVDDRTAEQIIRYLREDGVRVEPYLAEGQLQLLTRTESYVRGGTFDPDAMIALLESETRQAVAEGYTALRVTGEMSWALRGLPGSERLIEYETKLNQFFPGKRCLALCQYDRRRFGPDVLLDVLRTHPIAVIGTQVYENFYYIPPDELLGPASTEAELDRWIGHLAERRRLERESQERRLYLEATFDAVPDAVITLDERHQVLDWNYAAEELFGYAAREAIGRELDQLVTGTDADMVAEAHALTRSVVAGERVPPTETVRYRRDGTPVDVLLAAAPIIQEGDVIGVVATYRDITTQKRTREALQRSERKFRSFVEQSQDAIVLTDERGAIVEWNQAAERILGWDRERVLGRPLWEVQIESAPREQRTPEASERLKASILKALRRGQGAWLNRVRERRVLRPDGEQRIVQTMAFSIDAEEGFRLGSASRDVTGRREMEQELRESRERYRNLVENQGEGIGIVASDERFVFANPAAHEIFGVPPGNLVGRRLQEFLDEEGEAIVAAQTEERRAGERGSYELEIARPDGEKRTILVTASPQYGSQGQFEGSFAVFRDITERKRLEEQLEAYADQLEERVEARTRELRQAQEKLLRREKLAMLGQLAGSINHELRGPLGNIKSGAYFLNMALEEPEEDVQETIELLEREVDRAETIVRSLLSFVRTEEPRREAVDVNALLGETVSGVEIPEVVTTVREMDEDLPTVWADPEQLRQVFRNLISNAVDAMPEGGRLTVETFKTSAVSGKPPRPAAVVISIADTGAGIRAEQREKVFEPLFSTKPQGVGLGLALARMLVEAHGGAIEVASQVGEGSTFTVRLPLEGGRGDK